LKYRSLKLKESALLAEEKADDKVYQHRSKVHSYETKLGELKVVLDRDQKTMRELAQQQRSHNHQQLLKYLSLWRVLVWRKKRLKL
jgi:hypothetical protein